jgi:hypothetical protein
VPRPEAWSVVTPRTEVRKDRQALEAAYVDTLVKHASPPAPLWFPSTKKNAAHGTVWGHYVFRLASREEAEEFARNFFADQGVWNRLLDYNKERGNPFGYLLWTAFTWYAWDRKDRPKKDFLPRDDGFKPFRRLEAPERLESDAESLEVALDAGDMFSSELAERRGEIEQEGLSEAAGAISVNGIVAKHHRRLTRSKIREILPQALKNLDPSKFKAVDVRFELGRQYLDLKYVWAARAQQALSKMLARPGQMDIIGKGILGATHPTGTYASASSSVARADGDVNAVVLAMDVNWKSGVGGQEKISIRWRFNESGPVTTEITLDNAGVKAGAAGEKALDGYLRTGVYPVVQSNANSVVQSNVKNKTGSENDDDDEEPSDEAVAENKTGSRDDEPSDDVVARILGLTRETKEFRALKHLIWVAMANAVLTSEAGCAARDAIKAGDAIRAQRLFLVMLGMVESEERFYRDRKGPERS